MSVDVVGLGILQFGVAPALALWDTTDANAGVLMVDLPTGGAVNVPVMVVGNGIMRTDLGWFDGLTQPEFAVADLDKDSYISLSHSADDVHSIYTKTGVGARSESVSFTETQTKFGGVTSVVPLSDDLAALGTTALQWADLYIATGGVIGFAGGVDTLTHSASTLTLAGIATLAGPATLTLFNTATTTLNFAGAATTIAIGAAASVTTWTGQSVSLTGANSTNNTSALVENTSNAAAASHAYMEVKVGGTTSTGDPHLRFTIPGGTSWHVGIDNSDSDDLVIGIGTALGTTRRFQLASRTSGAVDLGSFYDLQSAAVTVDNGATAHMAHTLLRAFTLTLAGTTQVTALQQMLSIGALTINQSGGAVTVNKGAGISVVGPTAGASVTLTHASAIRALTGGAAVNVSGMFFEAQTAGTTGNYQILMENGGTEPVSLANHVGIAAVDVSGADATLALATEVAVAVDADETKFSNKLLVRINGASYYIMLTVT